MPVVPSAFTAPAPQAERHAPVTQQNIPVSQPQPSPPPPVAHPPAAVPPATAEPTQVTAAAPAAVSAAVNGQLAGKLADLGLTPAQADAVLALSREVVERVVWEVVPQLAETMIKEEIARLMKE
jgi:hypothetical protein